jgi:putative RNA 2'-phosphotransferase
MNPKELVRKSKHMSLVLRHDPASVGLTLDDAGWVNVGLFLLAMKMTRDELNQVVADNNKKRFEFSPDGKRLRASQGHSVDVDLGYEEKAPPEHLWHGTGKNLLGLIFKDGLLKMSRHHVHLSKDKETALIVARRRSGPSAMLRVLSGAMQADGFTLFVSTNGVWLTEHVPAKYLEVVEA